MQTHLLTLIKPLTILLGHSLESDLRALKLEVSHGRCIDTALLFYHPRGQPLKPGLVWLTRKWLCCIIQHRGASGHNPEEDARARIDLLKTKITVLRCKNGALTTDLLVPRPRPRSQFCLPIFRVRVRRVPRGFEPIWRTSRVYSVHTHAIVGRMAHARSSTTVIPTPGIARRRLRLR